MKLLKFTVVTLLMLIIPLNYGEAQVNQGHEPVKKLYDYFRQASSQKLHIHFNKNRYNTGEVMWFNAYLLDAVNHMPDTAETNIYVDLINSDGVIMEKRVLLALNGVAEGDISLPVSLPDGNYYVRAYTSWMRNSGDDFLFERYFYISNPRYEDIIPRAAVRSNRRFNSDLDRMAEAYEIGFFPEGGDMVTGVKNRIAFKAVDALGRGIEAEGFVLDGFGNEITTFKTVHAGMGSFELEPQEGGSYQASVSFNGSRPVLFNLPAPVADGIALRVERDNGNIIVNLYSGPSGSDQHTGRDIFLIAHTRGKIIHSGSLSFTGNMANATIPETSFPTGIAHITVFSGGLPEAERLVFVNRDDSFVFIPRVVKTEFEGQQYIGVQMEAVDTNDNIVEGHFSLSVLAGDFTSPGSSPNILSNFLLSSDLKGIIEDPQNYLDPEKDMDEELDHLMMTHGWRRFSWESVLAGEIPEVHHKPTSTLTVQGRLTNPAKNEPVNNQFVQMKVLSGHNDVYETRTNNRGIFTFDDLAYPDNFRIEISSTRLPGNYPPDIELFAGDIRGHGYVPNIYTGEELITQRSRNWSRVADAGRSPYESLPERGPTPQQYGVPDQTIYIDRETVTHRTVYDVLVERGQGLQIYGNQIMFRGPVSINLSSEPMFMLDGVQTSKDAVLSINPREVERIELFRGASASMFGVRGGGGVIIAYTRRPGDPGFQDAREYLITGYHTSRQFYSDVVSLAFRRGGDDLPARAVYWEPGLVTGYDDENIVYFPFSGDLGPLKIVIEGIGPEGGMGFGEFTLELRQ